VRVTVVRPGGNQSNVRGTFWLDLVVTVEVHLRHLVTLLLLLLRLFRLLIRWLLLQLLLMVGLLLAFVVLLVLWRHMLLLGH